MDFFTLGAAFLAGVLTILSPCVLPILPIVFGSAAGQHRFAPVALAMGLSVSFAALGLFLATAGFSLNFDPALFRTISAALLILFGLVLFVPAAQARMQLILSPIANRVNAASNGVSGNGIWGQFGIGLLLGAVWSPCVGPTLGAATLLASQGTAFGQVVLVMLVFGIGVSIPLLLFGAIGRQALLKLRGSISGAVEAGKKLLGLGMVFAGFMVVTGFDRGVETWVLENGPQWASNLSTRF